jgi:hypothetical protein
MNQENQLRKQIRAIDDQKKRIYSDIQNLRNGMDQYTRPTDSQSYSKEALLEKISFKEQQLTTSNIDKRQESKLTN